MAVITSSSMLLRSLELFAMNKHNIKTLEVMQRANFCEIERTTLTGPYALPEIHSL